MRLMEKEKTSLSIALDAIRKDYGKEAIMWGNSKQIVNIDVIPSGSLSLDIATGIGGIPRGRLVEIFSEESKGKTTLALHIIAEAQKMGLCCSFVDCEHALDKRYATAIGVDFDNLLISQPDTAQTTMNIIEALLRSGELGVIVLDSVAMMPSEKEVEEDFSKEEVGSLAKIMSKSMRKLLSLARKSKTSLIFLNQVREKVSMFGGGGLTTPGGRALRHGASMRIWLDFAESPKKSVIRDSNGDPVGLKIRAEVVKNKLAVPFGEAFYDIKFGKGISRESELVDLGVMYGVLTKSGAWFRYKDENIAQGRENCKKFFAENKNIANELEHEIRIKAGILNHPNT